MALLYSLDLQYRIEFERKGNTPLSWQPSPRNRPDQFLRWILDALDIDMLDTQTLEGLFERLQVLRLARVASVLESTLEHYLKRHKVSLAVALRRMPLDSVLATFSPPSAKQEAHPQVRKIAGTLSAQLDCRWCVAVEKTMAEVGTDLPAAAQLLGGLPPGFHTINEFIYHADTEASTAEGLMDLSVLEFYALVTGTFPKAGEPLESTINALQPLSEEDLLTLRRLPNRQLQELCALSPETLKLLHFFPDPQNARSTLEYIAALPFSELEKQLSELTRGEIFRNLLRKTRRQKDPVLKSLQSWSHGSERYHDVWVWVQAGAWEQIKTLDEDTLRMMGRGQLSQNLLETLGRWDAATAATTRQVLDETWWPIEIYRGSLKGFEEMMRRRTHALLGLRDVFPRSVARLDAYFAENSETILIEESEDISSFALTFSARTLHHLSSADSLKLYG